ncbi:hypothetical protein HCH_03201 [Hahella chejuensis KCTC 2396]|uniref:Uncharacterized protein n=1 Tax=Hahella chejuensis (strain KCTC 2396) TaxID=349521 RepID=Q2SHB3_HAHCH|nr:hypothetical protein HCH_03201 [Hahella chejuensis KCTC 2396]
MREIFLGSRHRRHIEACIYPALLIAGYVQEKARNRIFRTHCEEAQEGQAGDSLTTTD